MLLLGVLFVFLGGKGQRLDTILAATDWNPFLSFFFIYILSIPYIQMAAAGEERTDDSFPGNQKSRVLLHLLGWISTHLLSGVTPTSSLIAPLGSGVACDSYGESKTKWEFSKWTITGPLF